MTRDEIIELRNSLQEKISEWESKMDDDDKSLYSLGLRHAVDEVDNLLEKTREEALIDRGGAS